MLRPPIATFATRADSRRSGATTARNGPWTRSGCASRSGRGHRERHLSQFGSATCGRHHDPHILPEPREKHEELLGGESVSKPTEEPGGLRLRDEEPGRELRPIEPEGHGPVVDLPRQSGF